MTQVACSVKSCFFNDIEEELCKADRIVVKNETEDDTWVQAGSMGDLPYARTSYETLCHTFRPRDEEGSRDRKGDGMKRK